MKNFYEIEYGGKYSEIFISLNKQYDEYKLKTGLQNILTTTEINITSGKRFYDILRLQIVGNFAISKKVMLLLVNNNISGYIATPIKIRDRQEEYYLLQITGKCGQINRPEISGPVKGYDFDLETWDGSDIFCPIDSLVTLCNEKVKKIFNDNNVSNIEFTKIDEVEWYNA